MVPLSRVLFTLGAVLLLHASYGCSHYRELLQELEESAVDESSLASLPQMPLDVWIEVVVGFMSLLLSELTRGGSTLRPIHKTDTSSRSKNKEAEPLMAPIYRTRDFDIYSTRGHF